MSFPAFAWSVRFFSLAVFLGLAGLVLAVDPEQAAWAPPVFCVVWFLAGFGGAAWGLMVFYQHFLGEEGMMGFQRRLIEQALLISTLSTAIVLLRYVRALEWWTAGLALAFVLLIEFTLRKRSSTS
ncbi:MAG: hypothetical protein KA731_01365 [Candidatus Moranbacteria bacterium]|nr:hypothetical protein [Candidatus Moranbacteria bacterium]MBP6034108.1 hypothetical protein [Candidatus Moranbacteria bacterium]MBP7695860.1 hypothetical protein [Candidatus Moranbacteria bacterium]